jgi:hypothetical protein
MAPTILKPDITCSMAGRLFIPLNSTPSAFRVQKLVFAFLNSYSHAGLLQRR